MNIQKSNLIFIYGINCYLNFIENELQGKIFPQKTQANQLPRPQKQTF